MKAPWGVQKPHFFWLKRHNDFLWGCRLPLLGGMFNVAKSHVHSRAIRAIFFRHFFSIFSKIVSTPYRKMRSPSKKFSLFSHYRGEDYPPPCAPPRTTLFGPGGELLKVTRSRLQSVLVSLINFGYNPSNFYNL